MNQQSLNDLAREYAEAHDAWDAARRSEIETGNTMRLARTKLIAEASRRGMDGKAIVLGDSVLVPKTGAGGGVERIFLAGGPK